MAGFLVEAGGPARVIGKDARVVELIAPGVESPPQCQGVGQTQDCTQAETGPGRGQGGFGDRGGRLG